MEAEGIVNQAMAALREGDADRARELVGRAVEMAPDRPDIMHALAVLQLQLGEPGLALQLVDQAEELARSQGDERAAALMAQISLTRAAACEDSYDPAGAEDAFREVLEAEPHHPRAPADPPARFCPNRTSDDFNIILEYAGLQPIIRADIITGVVYEVVK